MSSRVRRAIQAHELAVFYVLACAVSWTAWSVMTFGGNSPVATVAGALSVFGPMVDSR